MEELEQARAVLPWWIGWGGALIYLPLAAGVSALGAQWAARLGLHGFAGQREAHWTERARLGMPARVSTALCAVVLPALFALSAYVWTGPLSLLPEAALGALAAAVAVAVVLPVHLRVLRTALPKPPKLGYWLQGLLVMMLVIRPVLPLVLGLGLLAPRELYSPAMILWTAAALLLFGLAMRGSTLRLGRALGIVRPASERLKRIVAGAAGQSDVKPRGVYELCWPMVNAAAFPAGSLLVFSDAALRELDDDELAAVTAHELGHLGESRQVLALRGLQALVFLPLAALRPIAVAYGETGYLLLVALALVVTISLKRTMQRMEQRADRQASEQPEQAAAYVRALEAIYRSNGMPAVLWRRATHPHLYDRLTAAGHSPDYPRPKPPPRGRMYVGWIGAMVLAVLSITAGAWAPALMGPPESSEDWPHHLALASGVGGAWELGTLADHAAHRGDVDRAAVLYRAAAALSHEPNEELARLVELLADAGRCEQARAVLDQMDPVPPALAHTELAGRAAAHAAAQIAWATHCGGTPFIEF